jgi:hypothetical protein
MVAMTDQAQAASKQAVTIMHQIAAHDGGEVEQILVGPAIKDVVGRMITHAATARLSLCPHLSWDSPAPAWWCSWAVGRLRCRECAVAAQRRIRGTPEDQRCDRCRKTRRTIHADLVQLPPVVVDLPSGAWCFPPTTVVFGLCGACQQSVAASAA